MEINLMNSRPILNAYYFRAHMYTLVPRHIREDMEWMADLGTTTISLAILEQDLTAVPHNLDWICREADRVGMKVFAVPSRWCGLVAGAPKVPSMFAVQHPELWLHHPDGTPHVNPFSGPCCDVNQTAVVDFWRETLTTLLTRWPICGLIWDEPKTLEVQPLPELTRFFDTIGAHAKSVRPDTVISMFLHSFYGNEIVESCSRIGSLDYFGCDGRPWGPADAPLVDNDKKVLLGGHGARFLAAARAAGKGGLLLIENHDVAGAGYDMLDRRLPEVLALNAEQWIYYYYPRNLEDSDRVMGIMAKHLKRLC